MNPAWGCGLPKTTRGAPGLNATQVPGVPGMPGATVTLPRGGLRPCARLAGTGDPVDGPAGLPRDHVHAPHLGRRRQHPPVHDGPLGGRARAPGGAVRHGLAGRGLRRGAVCHGPAGLGAVCHGPAARGQHGDARRGRLHLDAERRHCGPGHHPRRGTRPAPGPRARRRSAPPAAGPPPRWAAGSRGPPRQRPPRPSTRSPPAPPCPPQPRAPARLPCPGGATAGT